MTLTVPERLTTTQILVQWSVVESGSGIRGYDLDVSGDGGASWTHLLTETQNTGYTFTGKLGVAYTFRVRATDNVNNASDWAQAAARTVVVKKYYSVAGQRIAMRANGVLYYLHTDHLGSTSLTTDAGGSVVAEQRYLPYGEVRWVSGTLPTDLTYTGQRHDSYTQLAEMGARWYSPYVLRPGMGEKGLSTYDLGAVDDQLAMQYHHKQYSIHIPADDVLTNLIWKKTQGLPESPQILRDNHWELWDPVQWQLLGPDDYVSWWNNKVAPELASRAQNHNWTRINRVR